MSIVQLLILLMYLRLQKIASLGPQNDPLRAGQIPGVPPVARLKPAGGCDGRIFRTADEFT